jgi:hypothetical protein
MPTTPIKHWPYPAETDSPDVPRDIQALAVAQERLVNYGRGTTAGTFDT